jgi:hypothetical protein
MSPLKILSAISVVIKNFVFYFQNHQFMDTSTVDCDMYK